MRTLLVAVAAVILFLVIAVATWVLGRSLTVAVGADVATFDSGMIATVLGIVVGVPAALTISLGLRRLELRAAERTDRTRYEQVLRTINADLTDALEDLMRGGPGQRQPRDAPVSPFLGSGVWDSLRSSGQVERIRDPFLLRVIARAYDRIGGTGYLEKLAWELSMNPSARTLSRPAGTPSLVEEAMAFVAQQDVYTKAAIEHAREEIAKELAARPDKPQLSGA